MIFFVEKNERSLCNAKASHIISTKNIGIFKILKFEILTKHYLTRLLALNNWVQIFSVITFLCVDDLPCRSHYKTVFSYHWNDPKLLNLSYEIML